jgi:hypothetical protein
MGGIFKYDAEMGSGAMIYIPSFIKIGSAILKLIRGTQHGGVLCYGDHSSET